MIEALLKKVASLQHALFGGRNLLPHEQICLDAWRASLPADGRRVLDAQLAAVRLIQHQAGGAKVCFYYGDEESIPLFGTEQPDLHVATIVLRTAGGTDGDQTMRVKVFVHRGRFFSIEFPKRPARYMQQHGMRPDALQVGAVEHHMMLN
jgi:hypothetical protein